MLRMWKAVRLKIFFLWKLHLPRDGIVVIGICGTEADWVSRHCGTQQRRQIVPQQVWSWSWYPYSTVGGAVPEQPREKQQKSDKSFCDSMIPWKWLLMAICHYAKSPHPLQVAPKLCRIQEIFCFEGPGLAWLQLEEILLPEGIIRQLSWNSVLNHTVPLQWFSFGACRVISLWKHCAHLTVTDAGGSHVALSVTVRQQWYEG